MFREKFRSRTLAVFFCGVSLILALWLGIALWLPGAAGRAVSAAAERLSVPGRMEFSVVSSATRSARLACVILADGSDEALLRCDDIRVRYSPLRVHSGKVKEVLLKNAWIRPGALAVFFRHFRGGLRADPGFSARKVIFENCTFVPDGGARQIRFSGKFYPDAVSGWSVLHGGIKSDDDGQTADLSMEYRVRERELDASGTLRMETGLPFSLGTVPVLFPGADNLLSAGETASVRLKIRNLALDFSGRNIAAAVRAAEADFSLASGGLSVSDGYVVFDAAAGGFSGTASLADGGNAAVPVRFSIGGPECRDIAVETLPGAEDERTRWTAGPEFSCLPPSFSLKGVLNGSKNSFDGAVNFACEKPVFRAGTLPVSADSMKCSGSFTPGSWDRTLELSGFAVNGDSFFCHAPLVVSKTFLSDGTRGGTFRMERGHIEFPALKLQLGSVDAGETVSAGSVRMNGIILGGFSGKCTVSEDFGLFAAEAKANLLGQTGHLSFRFRPADPGKTELNLVFPAQKIAASGKKLLNFFVPILDSGSLDGSAELRLRVGPRAKTLSFSLTGGSFKLPEAGLSAEGLSLRMTMPDLAQSYCATGPSCPFSFEKLSAGGLDFGKGGGAFRIGADGVVRLESLSAEWCGGKFSAGPAELAPGRLSGIADCSGIDFAKMLTQLGLGRFAGTGSVSGKIPFELTEKGLVLYDGHLYSVPGRDGTLKGELLETVISGKDISNAHLSFACEMIRDMQYRWVKAGIGSSPSGGVKLALSFNGSPNRDLFYEPDLKNGGIRKSGRAMKLGALLLNLDEINLPADMLNRTVRFFLRQH